MAISQRVDIIPEYGERRDALDQNWHTFFKAAGLMATPLPNNPETANQIIQNNQFDGIVLSGGNDLVSYGGDAPERDETEKMLLDYAILQKLPLMGICRGLQFIQASFGATLKQVLGHVSTRHEIIINGNSQTVNSYHNFGSFEDVSDLETLAVSKEGVIESVRHREHRIHGIMWHPEREAPFRASDISLFQDFFGD
ncbi:MAG: C26 family cysteine hydrolase domain-containing family [Rhodospirillales bacterium]|nr:C26 family cysteine hydrolase domain-containing family [Rhodospirillales bacterium]